MKNNWVTFLVNSNWISSVFTQKSLIQFKASFTNRIIKTFWFMWARSMFRFATFTLSVEIHTVTGSIINFVLWSNSQLHSSKQMDNQGNIVMMILMCFQFELYLLLPLLAEVFSDHWWHWWCFQLYPEGFAHLHQNRKTIEYQFEKATKREFLNE